MSNNKPLSELSDDEEYLTHVPTSEDIIIKKEKRLMVELSASTSEQEKKELVKSSLIHYLDISIVARACFSVRDNKWYLYLGTLDDDEIFKMAEQKQNSKESDLDRLVRAARAIDKDLAVDNSGRELIGSASVDFVIPNKEFIDLLMDGRMSVLNRTEKEYRSVRNYTKNWLRNRKVFNIVKEEESKSNATS